MFPIRCDHRKNFVLFSIRCKAEATKHLLHHPSNGYGKDPQVLLLCEKHFQEHLSYAVTVVRSANQQGVPLVLSSVVKEAGNI